MLLKRNRPKSYNMSVGEVTSPTELTIKYPYEIVNAPNLVKFLFLVHERGGLVPQLEFKAYLRDMKKLLDEIGEEQTIALILKAGEVSNNPFTIKFLRRLHEENKDSTSIESEGQEGT